VFNIIMCDCACTTTTEATVERLLPLILTQAADTEAMFKALLIELFSRQYGRCGGGR